MGKFLIIKFRDAKIFENQKHSKDRSFENAKGKTRERKSMPHFKEPVTVYQISNVLHVLFGERPVPSLRGCLYSRVEELFELANSSKLKLSEFTVEGLNGKKKRFCEILKIKKAVFDSYNPSPQLNWEIIRKYTREHFEWLTKYIEEIIGENPLNHHPDYVREKLFEKRDSLGPFNQELKTRKIQTFMHYIKDGKTGKMGTPSRIVQNSHVRGMVFSGIEKVSIVSGEIAVPISDEQLERLSNSRGCATILEGGFVWIDSVKDGNNISRDGFVNVSEISTETVMP